MKSLRRIFAVALAAVVVMGLSERLARADSAVSWGSSAHGALGTGATADSHAPATVSGFSSGVSAVAGGNSFSLGMQNGALYAWGKNSDGEFGNGGTISSSTPVAVPGMASGVTAFAAGNSHVLAVKNGAAYAWGDNFYGQLGSGSLSNSTLPVAVYGMSSGVTAIAAGASHSLSLRNGGAYAWGSNTYGQLGIGTTLAGEYAPTAVTGLGTGVTAIAAGSGFSLALQNGAAYAWGANSSGSLGDGTTANSTKPIAVIGLTSGITAIAAGGGQGLAVRGGNVYAWGSDSSHQLGDNSYASETTPEEIDPTDLNNIVAVAAGLFSSYALSSDGSLWVWGDNARGELGLGTNRMFYATPQHLLPTAGYAFTSIDIDSEGAHALATVATIASFGDVNGDGTVDISDLTLLANNFGSIGSNLAGDINGDGQVNISDLTILATHFGFGTSGLPASFTDSARTLGLPSIPEPTGLELLCLASSCLLRRRKVACR